MNAAKRIQGVFAATYTPMHADGSVLLQFIFFTFFTFSFLNTYDMFLHISTAVLLLYVGIFLYFLRVSILFISGFLGQSRRR